MPSLPQPISPERRASPKGHYSPGILAEPFIFVSGQLPTIPPGSGDIEAEAESTMAAMLEVLAAGGRRPEHLVRVTVYLAGVEHWEAFNAVYARFLGEVRPARTVVPVPALHHGYLLEIDAIAVA